MNSYWLAAERLISGEALYTPMEVSNEVYRYPPWFAALWVPLTFLPKGMVSIVWLVVLLVATAAIVGAMVRTRRPEAIVLAGITAPPMLIAALSGNAQGIVFALLFFGIDRRAGPVWLALAASLKFIPAVYALIYLARREYGRFALTAGLTVLLVAPMLTFDLAGYQTEPGGWFSIWVYSPWLGIAVSIALFAVAVVLTVRRSAYLWLPLNLLGLFGTPRSYLSNIAYMNNGTTATSDRAGRGRVG